MTGFPWTQGDSLLANDLNAAIANAATLFPPPGDGVSVPPGGSIQAVIDLLPATGGEVRLSSNTTYVLTAAITSSTNNVCITAPGWGTVIQRGPGLTATNLFTLSGSGCRIEGMTFDGDNVVNNAGAEVAVSGANSRITNVRVINSAGPINVSAAGVNSRVDHCTIIGLSQAANQSYGIWAEAAVPVCIDHNTVTGTGVCGIGANGAGTVIEANKIDGCCAYTGIGGGQIFIDCSSGSAAQDVLVMNNSIGQGASSGAGGVEVAGNNVTIVGNRIANQMSFGILWHFGCDLTVTGNTVLNPGLNLSGTEDGVVINGGATDFVISGNHIGDNNTTPNMRFAVNINAAGSDRFTIAGNTLGPQSWGQGSIGDSSTGVDKVIHGNVGTDTFSEYLSVGATLALVPSGVVFLLAGTGTVTSITGGWTGRTVTLVPTATPANLATGGNIGNAMTGVTGVPIIVMFDGSSWRCK